MIPGIDVARYEPNIDWFKVMAAGYRFAFIKASQATYKDSKFDTHWHNAKVAGMPRGAYHFYDTSVSPETQAEFFWNLVKNDSGELPLVVDLEYYTSGPYYGSENWYRFISHLNHISNNHPLIIYTGYYYWTDNVTKHPAVQDINWFGKYPLWIANYETNSPLIPKPWTTWMFWQYSESGIVDGITDGLGRPTECDLDAFFGTEEQFQTLLDGMVIQPPNGETNVTTYYKAIGNITIRTGSGTTYPPVSTGEKYVLTGDIVETNVAPQNGFVNISNIYRNDVPMIVADPAWCGSAYLQVTTYTPPAPPPVTTDDDLKIFVNDQLTLHMIGKIQPS
jgi:lysozyme